MILERTSKFIHAKDITMTNKAGNKKSLCHPDQLPEIDSDKIIISLREEGKGRGKDYFTNAVIVLYWGEQEIWRESMGFEYYRHFIDMGKVLKMKYGDRLIDFDAEYTADLGGDYGRAFDEVRTFRKSLSGKDGMSDAEFDFVSQSGNFSKYASTYWKALEFAKERHAGQTRDDGTTPYFEHILGVIDNLRQYGEISDYVFTIAALHDILEDTETTKEELYSLLRTYPSDEYIEVTRRLHKFDQAAAEDYYDLLNNGHCRDVIAEVGLLTRSREVSYKDYADRVFTYDSISREKYRYGINGAAQVKLADRLHNLMSLPSCGDPEKFQKYILETEECIMPWRAENKRYEVLFAQIEKQLKELKSMAL